MVRRAPGRSFLLAAVGVTACLTLSACEDAASTDGQRHIDTSTTLDTAPIVVGGLVDQSGLAGGQDLPGVMKAWAGWVNKHDGIAGHPVDLAIYDPKGDPTAALSTAADLVAKKPAFIVLYSNGDSAVGDYLSKTGIPVIGMGYSPTVWGGKIAAAGLDLDAEPNFFHIGTSQSSLADIELQTAKANGATKVAVAACAEVAACAQIGPIYEAEASRIGMEYAGLYKVSSSAPNYTSQCFEAIKEGVDVIELGISHSTANRLIKDCLDQGYQGSFSAQGATPSTDMLPVEGATITGAVESFPWWSQSDAIKNFNQVLDDAGVSSYRSSSVSGVWASLELARTAASVLKPGAAGPNAGDMLAALQSLKDEDLDGLLPMPLSFGNGPSPYVSCAWAYKYEAGHFESFGDSADGIRCDDQP